MAYNRMGTGREYPARVILSLITAATIALVAIGIPAVPVWLISLSLLLPACFMPSEWYFNVPNGERKEAISRWLRTYRRAFIHPSVMLPSIGSDGHTLNIPGVPTWLLSVVNSVLRRLPTMTWWWAASLSLLTLLLPSALPGLTVVVTYWCIQAAFSAARKYQFEGEELPATGGGVAELASMVKQRISISKVSSISILAVSTFLIGGGGIFMNERLSHLARWTHTAYHYIPVLRDWQPWQWYPFIWPVLGLLLGVLVLAYQPSRAMAQEAKAPWLADRQEREMWMQRWSACKVPPPAYQLEVPYPVSTFKAILFQVAPGTPVEKYQAVAGQMASMLGTSMIVIAPTVGRDETGQTTAGVRNPSMFELSWAQVPLGTNPAINSDLDKLTRKFVIKCVFRQAFMALKLAPPMFDDVESLVDSDQRLWRAKFWLAPGCTVEDVVKKETALSQKIGCEWLRVGRSSDEYSVNIIFGDPPSELDLSGMEPQARKWLQSLQWDGWFRASKIYNPMGETPKFIQQAETERGLVVAEFLPVDGLPVENVRLGKDNLVPALKKHYVEVEEADAAGAFRVIYGDSDPLDRTYLYMDYGKELLLERRDRPDITFWVGVGADGNLVQFDHDSVLPHAIVAGSSGMGKSCCVKTPVILECGTHKTMGTLQIGDKIFNDQGKPCRVTRLYDIYVPERAFRLHFDDGFSIDVSDTHRWLVEDAKRDVQDILPQHHMATRGHSGQQLATTQEQAQLQVAVAPRVVNTQEIFDTMLSNGGAPSLAIRKAPAVQFQPLKAPLPIDPYTLGAWLGSGLENTGCICSADVGIFREIIREHPLVRASDRGGLVSKGKNYRAVRFAGLTKLLKATKLINNKHIPDLYLSAPHAQRLALLQGLMDAAGSCSSPQGACSFANADKRVVDNVYQLVRSLGIKCQVRHKRLRQEPRKDTWRVQFTTDLPVFRLQHKLENLPQGGSLCRTSEYHYIERCEEIKPVPMRCIEVDSPNHMYLVGENLVPTHNSTLLHSMITQLAFKNTPAQWNLWVADPKNEMQRYINLPHLTHFIDMNSIHGPEDSVYSTLADMLDQLVEEMERRYNRFQTLAGRPQKLSQARAIPGAADDLPFITCLVEECADYFAPPALKVYKADYERMVFAAELLARKARGAGIYLIMATQRPTKQSIPSVIKGQASRIGFGCPDKVSSMVVIDQPGLEAIRTRGRGLVVTPRGYSGFRAFYMRKPDEDHPDDPDDVEIVMERLGVGNEVEMVRPNERNIVPPPSPDSVWGADAENGGTAGDTE